jgi:hypothetical protein
MEEPDIDQIQEIYTKMAEAAAGKPTLSVLFAIANVLANWIEVHPVAEQEEAHIGLFADLADITAKSVEDRRSQSSNLTH